MPNKLATSTTLCLLLFFGLPTQAQDSPPFPKEGRRLEVYDRLISEIQRVDAIGIATRNTYKDTNWKFLTRNLRSEFGAAQNWTELRQVISRLHKGFTNVHSHIKPGALFPPVVKQTAPNANQEGPLIGFTYPPVEFFAAKETPATKEALNKTFREFVDVGCRAANPVSCAHRFVRDTQPLQHPTPKEQRIEKCESVAIRYTTAWTLNYSGHSLCVLTRDAVTLVKIKLFASWGQSGIYCGPNASKGSACHDIYNALQLIKRAEPEYLILDVQNNRGGSENTPYIAAFATAAFTDLRVEYKKIRELDDSKMRKELFYFNKEAETWFKSLKTSKAYDTIAYGDYLPARADFCRGARDCSIAPIKRHALSNAEQKGIILTNGNCVSSCDDLVWRLKEANNWKVVGQTPVTDGAYSRIEGGIFLNSEGQVSTQTWGDGEEPATSQKDLLVRYRVPISRTVNGVGELLEGNVSVLDAPIAHSKAQFTNNDAHLANAAFHNITKLSQ